MKRAIIITITGLIAHSAIAAASSNAPDVIPSINQSAVFGGLSSSLEEEDTTAIEKKPLSMKDAILLSLRFNPNVHNAELDRVTQRFALDLAKWQFAPHYSFTVSRTWSSQKINGEKTTSNGWTATPGAKWESSIGTTVQATSNNAWGPGSPYGPSVFFDITQPLLKGFGKAVTEANLQDAYDSEEINKLNLKSIIMKQVSSTIQAYIQVVQDQQSLKVDQSALKRAKKSLKQTYELIKAGRNAASDAIQVRSQVASAEAAVQRDKNQLELDQFTLLDTIGIKPTAQIKLDGEIPLDLFKLPSLTEAKTSAIQNNIGYVSSVIGIESTKRDLMIAKDNMRWDLSLEQQYTVGGSGGIEGMRNGKNYNSSTILSLTIPIDDLSLKADLLDKTIGLQEAEINLNESKRQLMISIISQYNSILNQKKQIELDEASYQLAKLTLRNTQKQYQAGAVSSLTLSQQSDNLTTANRQVVNDRISYFQSMVNFDEVLSHTLETWNISVEY